MVRKLDEILVVDLEATCWEDEPRPDMGILLQQGRKGSIPATIEHMVIDQRDDE